MKIAVPREAAKFAASFFIFGDKKGRFILKFNKGLYFITDSTGLTEKEFLRRVELGLKGGVALLQLREKDRSTRDYLTLAQEVHRLAQAYDVPLIIDDRVDVALAMGAEGVHVGQSDLPVALARRLVGPDKIVGATAKTVPQALEACEQGADYLGVGAIFPTATKVKTALTSTETLDQICRAVPIPVYPIGGLKRENLHVLQGIPIGGFCVVSAVMQAPEPELAVQGLKEQARSLGLW